MSLHICDTDFENNETLHFQTSLRNQFKKFDAKNIEFSIGYYYLSGFFTVEDQYYYFSISDVRHFNDGEILVRTAKHNKDFTGGSNRFFKMTAGLGERIARSFNLELKTTNTVKKTPSDLAKEAFDKKYFSKVVTSGRQAVSIIFRLIDLFGYSSTVTESKYGRYLSAVKHESKYFNAYYSGDSKRLEITFY